MATLLDVRRSLRLTNKKIAGGTFGIEIETETKTVDDYPSGFFKSDCDNQGNSFYRIPMEYWKAVHDGSLRDFGMEFVLKEPLDYDSAVLALQEFASATEGVKFINGRHSTSVHVHVNFNNETLLTMANFITIWVLLENILLDFSGQIRRSNCFALGTRVAEQQISDFIRLFSLLDAGNDQAISYPEGTNKYAALNLASLHKLGSLEARSFRGTTDVNEIMDWVSVLHAILRFARQGGLTPRKFFASYHERGVGILEDIFGSLYEKLLCEGHEAMLERQELAVFRLVSSVKTWETFGVVWDLPKEKKSSVKRASLLEAHDNFVQWMQYVQASSDVFPDAVLFHNNLMGGQAGGQVSMATLNPSVDLDSTPVYDTLPDDDYDPEEDQF